MGKRSRVLLGAAALLVTAGILLVVLIPRRAAAPAQPVEPPPAAVTQAQPAARPPAAPAKPSATARKAPKKKPPTPAQTGAPAPAQAAATAPAPAVEKQPPAAAAPAPRTAPKVEQPAQTNPALRVDSPADGAVYHSSVEVRGRVRDSEAADGAAGMDVLSWTIAGTDRSGNIPFSPDGSFSVSVPLLGLKSDISLEIHARRKDGRVSDRKILLRDDGKGPAIAILSPGNDSPYTSAVSVRGTITAPGDSGEPTSELGSASWAIEGTKQRGPIQPAADGGFEMQVPLVGLHGDLVLHVEAVDKNGRASSVTRRLRESTAGPELQILSPADHSVFTDTVSVQGAVSLPAEGASGDVKKLSWRAIGKPSLAGDVALSKDGSFDFSVSTRGITDDLVLELTAEDGNGHIAVKAITLLHPPAPVQTPAASPAAAAPQAAPPAAPTLTLEAPANGSAYRASVAVKGSAQSGGNGKAGPPVSVSWTIAGTPLSGAADVNDDGTFSFVVPTAGLHGTQALRVRAAQGSGPAAVTTVVLYEDMRGLPLSISSPADGSYYRSSTILEGSVGDESLPAGGELASLAWKIPTKADLNGHAVVDKSGSFKLAIPFSGLSGDVTLTLTAQDKSGHLTERTLTLHDGTKKPGLTVTAPSDGGAFGSLIRVGGSATDPYAGTPGMAGFQSLTWMVAPTDYSRHSTPARGTATLAADGSFRFPVLTSGLAGPQLLTVTVRANNGNETEKTIRLVPGTGDVPGFQASPADGAVSVGWQQVTFAVRYDLTYGPAHGPAGARHTITDVSPPFTVKGLDNGSLYDFSLAVKFDDGGSGASVPLQAIPLSPETLAPAVKGDYQQIRLSWKTIPGAPTYDVWRSLSGKDGYTKIASALSAGRYVDTSAEFGKDYFYEISPAGLNAPMSAPGTGRTLAFPEDKLAVLGTAAVQGASRVTIDGGYAFVAAGERGVSIVDVSNPKSPVRVGRVQTRNARQVAVRGEYAFVADGDAGLRVLDVSDPREPGIIGSCKTLDARAVALSGRYAFVADGAKGLKVIDVSDVRNMPRVAVLDTTDARDLVVSDGRLFLADGAGGLKIFGLSRPASPVLIATIPATDAQGVDVQGGTAILADGAQGLRIVNVRNPARPIMASTFETDMAASAATDGRFAYLTDRKGMIQVVDIKDPTRPTLFTAHAANGPVSVAVAGNHAYIADAAGLEIMRIQIYGRSFRVASCNAGGKAFQVAVSGDWAYVAAHAGGLRVVKVSDPSQVSNSSAVASAAAQNAQSVSVQDKLAFVADGTGGIRIFDASPAWKTPAEAPVEAGSYRTGGYVYRVVASGSVAFAANGDRGLRILDVSDPAAPSELGSLRTDDAHDVAVQKGIAYVADGNSGLRVVDVSDPAHPAAVSRPIGGNALNLALSGNLLLVGGSSGVRIFDITNPRAPRLSGTYQSDSAGDISMNGRYAFVAEGYRGLTVLDISHPAQPVVVSSCADVFAMGVAARGDYALVTDSKSLQVVRILIPDWLMH